MTETWPFAVLWPPARHEEHGVRARLVTGGKNSTREVLMWGSVSAVRRGTLWSELAAGLVPGWGRSRRKRLNIPLAFERKGVPRSTLQHPCRPQYTTLEGRQLNP